MSLTEVLDAPSRSAQPAAALLRVLDSHGHCTAFQRDAEIYGQEEPVMMLYRVLHGVVRTTRMGLDGRRQVGSFYYAGDLFGLEIGPLHDYSAEALSDCEVQMVRRSAVRTFAGDVELDRAILEATRGELQRTQDHVMLLGRKGAREKVAAFLLSLTDGGRRDSVDMPMGRQDMADYLGLTMETVSRMISQLQGDEIVRFPSNRRFQVTRRDALETLAG